jgi:Tfp pilus assembly protein PilX
MTALFIMAVTTLIVLAILDTEMLQYAALKNTLDYERARYLAEAGIGHALAYLESDVTWRGTIGPVEFPAGSSNTYTARVTDGAKGTIEVVATGTSGGTTRRLYAVVEPGG